MNIPPMEKQMRTRSRVPVNKNLFYGFFIGVFGGALVANIVAGVNNTATTAILVITLAVAIIGIALVAFDNDERIAELEDPNDVILNEKISDQVHKLDPDDSILNEKISEQVHRLDEEKSAK